MIIIRKLNILDKKLLEAIRFLLTIVRNDSEARIGAGSSYRISDAEFRHYAYRSELAQDFIKAIEDGWEEVDDGEV